MTDFEKAVRYICFSQECELDVCYIRYCDIEAMVHGDEKLIEKYSKKYEKLLDLLYG